MGSRITIKRLGYKSHITSISRRAPNRYFISLAETVARRTWKINTKKEGQLSCKLCVQLGAAFVGGRGGVGQVRGTFFKVLRVCRNPVYHERPDLASHSRNARVWRFTHRFRAPRNSFTAWHVSESKASATILNLLPSKILYRKVWPVLSFFITGLWMLPWLWERFSKPVLS